MAYQGIAIAIMLGLAIGTAMYVYFQGSEEQPHNAHGYQRDPDYPYNSWDDPSSSSSQGTTRRQKKKRAPTTDTCTICLDNMGGNNNIVINCGHEFHAHCINMWFRQERTCPICRMKS